MFVYNRVCGAVPAAFHRRARLAIATLIATWLCAIAAILIATHGGLRLNVSPSVPLGFYRLIAAAPARGDYVAVCPPSSNLFRAARARGYLMGGACPGDFVPMFKILAAGVGDDVRVEPSGVWINERLWPSSAPQRIDASGWKLPDLVGLRTTLHRNEVLLMSQDCRLGFDGRYFGTLPRSVITATAIPLFTW